MNFELPEDETASMAAAMGFTSFGSQLTKKRQFNHSADSYVEGQHLTHNGQSSKKDARSGGNKTPLGNPRILSSKKQTLDLGKNNIEKAHLEEDHFRSEYVDGKRLGESESDGKNNQVVTEKSVKTFSKSAVPEPQTVALDVHAQTDHHNPRFFQGTLQRKENNQLNNLANSCSLHKNLSGNHGKQEVQRNENWYDDYYDPSFNENPWERLEISMGLKSKGCWVTEKR
ncbi:hypothetical protein K3495_g11528 [Podosphaera aphanis]|nr:hypothetical protein K3495_g11528 [Podosphaera aphanis]